MENKPSISEIINKYRVAYQKFRPVYSLALNEKIYFNMAGFKHLIFKYHHRRKNNVIYARMVSVPLIKSVIKKSKEVVETRVRIETIKNAPLRQFLSACSRLRRILGRF